MKTYFLSPDGTQWKLHREGSDRATRVFDTKTQAMKESVAYMHEHGGSLRIQKENGAIQEERTYPRSADPRRSKG
jgi:hypothetical protein